MEACCLAQAAQTLDRARGGLGLGLAMVKGLVELVVLTLSGHEMRIAHDGAHGLELAAESQPDAVLCDIGLPGMDGYDVARAFRRHASLYDVFLVALSGYAQPEDLQRAREVGFDRQLAKTASLEALQRLLSEARRAAPQAPP